MNNDSFDKLVSRLEVMAKEQPARYTLHVIGVALLGFAILGVAIGFSLLSVFLLLGLGILVIASGGKALILVAKLGKLLILLALPAWAMLKSSFTLMFSRFPPPQGREIKAAEVPRLFSRLAEIRKRMNGPRIHHVLLTDELNAAIVQHPLFGLLGWERNYLILGLPLLQVLNEEEAMSVVAHEYGHLSGHHSRLGGFIYRFRTAWGRLQALSEQWNDWGSRLIARLFRWYAPYFNAYTFVFARQNEYVADRSSVEIAGRQNASSALMRINVASLFENEKFWPYIDQRTGEVPEPIKNRSKLWVERIQSGLDRETYSRYLDIASQRETDHLDTHPALKDRLSAMGGSTTTIDDFNQFDQPLATAASTWLGGNLEGVLSEFDNAWEERVSEQWRARYNYLKERKERLSAIEAQSTLTTEERWEEISLLGELKPETDLLPRLNTLLEEMPGHLSALYRRGVLLLERGDEAGIDDLEVVMKADADAILSACEAAWRFYSTRQTEKAEQYHMRWQKRADYLESVQAELKILPAKAEIAPIEVDESSLEAIRELLRRHGKHVKRAYLFRRVLKSDPQWLDYVLAFETSYLTLGDKGQKTAQELSGQTYPFECFIVHLNTQPYKKFKKSIKRQKIIPFYLKK